MQRLCWMFGVAACLLEAGGLSAQTSDNQASALAERAYAEERYRQVKDMAERLAAAQATLAAKLDSLKGECRRLQGELARRSTTFLTRDDLKPLERRLQELSGKYEADKREIIERLERLAKTAPKAAAETKPPAKASKTRKAKAAPKSAKP